MIKLKERAETLWVFGNIYFNNQPDIDIILKIRNDLSQKNTIIQK